MRSFGSLACSCVLSLLVLAVSNSSAECCCKEIAITISPIQQATQADVVFVGKVTDLETDLAMIEQYPGSGPIAHMVANVRIEESLHGVKGLTHVRIGYVPNVRAMVNDELQFQGGFAQGGFGGARAWRGGINLVAGQEACFFLQKHPTADFYVMLQYAYPLNKSDLGYDGQLKAVCNVLKAFDKPLEALQAKDASERQLAACALVHRYRTQRPSHVPVAISNEPIAAEESKLILNALGEMKWGELPFDQNGTFSMHNAFYQLGLTANDGWQQPQPKENEDANVVMTEAVGKWFKANADKYRVQRVVTKPQPATK
jgi:hypothetical protein